MNLSVVLHEANNIARLVSIINIIFSICLSIGWIIHSLRQCWFISVDYKLCKNTPNLHPIHRDVQYLSQQRKLYNLKTHFVKYVLIVMCLSIELIGNIWIGLTGIVSVNLVENNSFKYSKMLQISSLNPQCFMDGTLRLMYLFPYLIILYGISIILFTLLLVLLCILTRYLATRYLNHPFRRTLYKYIAWLVVQCIVIVICSNIYTIIFMYFIFPLFCFINWFVLLRDNLFLSRVLKSNLREIKLHAYSRQLYRQQLTAYKFYRFFNGILIIGIFCLSFFVLLYCSGHIIRFLSSSYCLLNLVYDMNINVEYSKYHSLLYIIREIVSCLDSFSFLLYSFSNSLPLFCLTLFPLVSECIKRYRSRNNVYRFNYDNIQHLLRRDS